ncbi:hypothetical protein BCR41DRAFT_426752, partial [Lobosporangium transversale]
SDRSELDHSSTAQEQQTINQNENENEAPLIRTRPLYANNKSAQPTRVHQHWHQQQEIQRHQQIHQFQHHQQLHLSQHGRQRPVVQNVGGFTSLFHPNLRSTLSIQPGLSCGKLSDRVYPLHFLLLPPSAPLLPLLILCLRLLLVRCPPFHRARTPTTLSCLDNLHEQILNVKRRQ